MNVDRDTNSDVVFEHPFEGSLTASVYRNDVKIAERAGITPAAGRFTMPLTYRETQFDGPLTIEWTGTDGSSLFKRTMTVDVVTPLVSISRLRTLFDNTNWTDAELREVENMVRVFIESYTGQTFRYEIGTEYVTGNGEKKVALPKRLIKATAIAGGPPGFFSISNNGWYLYIHNKNLLTTKEAPPEEYMDNNHYMTKGVIVVPDTYWKQFRVGARYEITGEWGYYSVPADVEEAAMLLANDYACGDNLYRDRYLDSMKSGDWTMVFNSGAFRGTGNVRADQLLEPYRRQGMIII
jgi:hypothetical protein